MKADFKFKELDLEERKKEASKILNQYPNRVPIICEPEPNSNIPLNKNRYILPNDMTVNQFIFLIRKKIDLNDKYAIFLITTKNVTLSGDISLKEVYNTYKDKQDNFLYIYCASEMIWG